MKQNGVGREEASAAQHLVEQFSDVADASLRSVPFGNVDAEWMRLNELKFLLYKCVIARTRMRGFAAVLVPADRSPNFAWLWFALGVFGCIGLFLAGCVVLQCAGAEQHLALPVAFADKHGDEVEGQDEAQSH